MPSREIHIDYDSYIPYYIQLMEALKERIQAGILKPGEQLPSEPEMCETYGVSRTVVRQALRELEFEGLISRRKGKGTFVAEKKIEESLVQKLTGFFQDMVERGHSIRTEVLKHQVEPASPKVARYLNLDVGTHVFNIERLRFIDGEPIVLVRTYIPVLLCPSLADYDLSTQSLYAILEGKFGLALSHGRRTIEAVPANEREAHLLDVEKFQPLILLDSVSYLENGTPMEYYHAVHRGDRSRFEVNLVRIRESKELQDFIQSNGADLPQSN